ncbi:transposase domain-containing protein [Streptomyces sp. NPDC093991]|uniref:transposase domain-containing protein n=1 Tax=unclassified Streptomyces TaxID=2593676 RepID=UPI00343D27A9
MRWSEPNGHDLRWPVWSVRRSRRRVGREQHNRTLPARLMVYLSMALWLDFGKGRVRVLRNLLRGPRWARGS